MPESQNNKRSEENKGFTIVCDKCGNHLSVNDNKNYIVEEAIDIFPFSDCDGYTTTYTLNLYCNNKDCRNQVEIYC